MAETSKTNSFAGLGEGIAKTPDMAETEVEITEQMGLLSTYVETLMTELNTDLSTKPIEQSDLQNYIWWLVVLRILFVNGIRLPFKLKEKRLCVPPYLFAVLECLGKVEDFHRGFVINIAKPNQEAIDKAISDVTVKEMSKISSMLESQFKAIGYGYATVVPCNSKFGEVDFMTFQLVANVVKNEDDKPAPFLATMFSLLGFSQMKETVTMARVGYGDLNHHRNLVRGVAKYERRQ